jgi:hypothetical protein
MMDLYVAATTMPPQADGVRRSAFLITRTSFRDLELSAVKSYIERFGGTPGMLPITNREPWQAGMDMDLPDGTRVESTWTFLAVPPEDTTTKLASQQYTGAYINEIIDFSDSTIINSVMASCGRYPSRDGFAPEYLLECERLNKPVYPSNVVADFNGPFASHWIRAFELNPPQGWKFFVQPPPLLESPTKTEGSVGHEGVFYSPNPAATFAKVQPKGFQYWLGLLGGAEAWFVQSRIQGNYASTLAGKRVFANFSEDMIVRETVDLEAFKNQTLYIGVDTSGHHPAAVLCFHVDATLYVVDEVAAQDVGFNSYTEDYLIPLLAGKYSEFEMIAIVDPSNPASALDRKTAMSVLLEAGLDARLASTNFFGDRIEAVNKHLNRRNGFRIYPAAEGLLKGFAGEYFYKEVRGKPGVHQASPDKTMLAADLMDALQYACLGISLDTGSTRAKPVKVPTRQRRAV